MAVEGVEILASGCRVFEEDHRAIVERLGNVGEGFYGCRQRRMDWRTRWSEEIEAQMDGAMFIGWTV